MSDKITISNYKKVNKGALLAFFDCEINQTSMILYGCKHFEKNNRRWIGLPNREATGEDGVKKYYPMVSFKDKAIHQRFSDAVIEALDEFLATEPPATDNNFDEIPF